MKKKFKSFTLISGSEDDLYWAIVAQVNNKGQFESKGRFHLIDKGIQRKRTNKCLHLFHESENGNTVAVHAYVTNEGKVGKSTFLLATKEDNNKRSRKTHKKTSRNKRKAQSQT